MPKPFGQFRDMMKSGAEIKYSADIGKRIADLMDISIDNQALLETILENQAFIMAKLNYPDDAEKFQKAHHEFFEAMEKDAHEKALNLRDHFAKMFQSRD